jgi:zinc/manganese transport system substrate-binding protein
MRHRLRLNLARATILLAVTGLAACSASPTLGSAAPTTPDLGGPSPAGTAAPIAVLGTENFYADLLAQIGGARVMATSLLNDPNADPHAFESNPQDAALVADARLVIVNGFGYDGFMDKLLAASPNPSRMVVNVQQILGAADGSNAHIWYDPATMPAVAAKVTTALDAIDPTNAFYFDAREAFYLDSLKPLAAKIAEMTTRFSGAPVAFTEPVAGYLAAAIGLQVLTPEGFQKSIEDGTDPAPADVAAETDLLTGKKVRVLLYNSQITTPITSQMHDLAVANGIPVVGVAETIPPAYSDYVSWQLAQMNQLEQALAAGG